MHSYFAMNANYKILSYILLCFFLLSATVTLSAQAELQRMQERLPQTDALRLSGKVGENNRGLLEARTELTPEERAIVNAENADRISLYRQIARNQKRVRRGSGRQRAIRIAQQARSGVWLQNAAGEWLQKP
ncbi:MAG: YdbL family protein [Verrucomicrobia bacterium]|nr:YdbL family protein [Verrucomicrobiota bacterium]